MNQKIAAHVESGQKWLKNKHLATFTKVQYKSLMHSVLSTVHLWCYFRSSLSLARARVLWEPNSFVFQKK